MPPLILTKDSIPTALLGSVARGLQRNLKTPLVAVARDEMSVDEASDSAYKSFIQSHANARYCGRLAAGDKAPIGQSDRDAVRQLAQEQQMYFERFATSVSSGKYTTDSGQINESGIEDRAGLYTLRLGGTANEGWASALGEDELIEWVLGGSENNCSICPDLADRGPYKPSEMPTFPQAGETPCIFNCRCSLQTSSGSAPPKSFLYALKFSPLFLLKHSLCSCK